MTISHISSELWSLATQHKCNNQIVTNTEPVQHKILNAELQKLKKRMLYEVQKPSLSRLLRHLISENASFRQ